MNKTVSDLQRVLGLVAKDDKCMTKLLMEEYLFTLCNVSNVSDKRCGLKIVGKPCEGKPHARFDEGLLGKQASCTSGLLYNLYLTTSLTNKDRTQ